MGKYESCIDFGTTLMHVRLNMNPFFTSVTQTIQAALFLSWEKRKKNPLAKRASSGKEKAVGRFQIAGYRSCWH